jgi:hypothetical protein
MAEIKVGDRVRIKDRADWPSPPGYRFAYAEGTVIKWIEYDEIMEDYKDYAYVRLEKAAGNAEVYIGNEMLFLVENLEKI